MAPSDRPHRPRRPRGKLIALVLAIAVNVLFLVVLVFTVSWQNRPPEAVTAELYAPPTNAPAAEPPSIPQVALPVQRAVPVSTESPSPPVDRTVRPVNDEPAAETAQRNLEKANKKSAQRHSMAGAAAFAPLEHGITLADEVLTPDSSRFWPADKYQPGRAQDSYDKQYVRDYLEQIHWNKQPPAPALPPDVARRTSDKYQEAYYQLTGHKLAV